MNWDIDDDRSRTLAYWEQFIGHRSFLLEAKAFKAIKESRAFQEGDYKTFDDYCTRRWGYRVRYVQYLMKSLQVCRDIRTAVRDDDPLYPFPLNEYQCRYLSPLTAEQRGEAWTKAIEKAKAAGGAIYPTEKMIQQSVAEVKRGVNQAELASLHEEMSTDELYDVWCSKFQDAQVSPDSFDWIITDPPYGGEWIETYGELSGWASETLKPGGSLMAMIGQDHLDKALQALCTALEYHWTIAYVPAPGSPYTAVPGRHVVSGWKPIVWLYKGPKPTIKFDNRDVFFAPANRPEKGLHAWQQDLDVFSWIIDKFTDPLDQICDPFLGAGTTGVAAKTYGRQFRGFDCDPEMCRNAEQRIAATNPPNFEKNRCESLDEHREAM